jgi:hypothetical protein
MSATDAYFLIFLRSNILIEIFRQRDSGKPEGLKLIVAALWDKLSEISRSEFAQATSDELNIISMDETYKVVRILPTEIWPACRESARLRTENKIIESIREGRFDCETDRCRAGALGTWISNLTPHFLMHKQLQRAVAKKLTASDKMESDYVFQYVFKPLKIIPGNIDYPLVEPITRGLRRGDKRFYDALYLMDDMFKPDQEDPWVKAFKGLYDQFEEKDIEFSETISDLDEDIPF